jgi:hypothetical protein
MLRIGRAKVISIIPYEVRMKSVDTMGEGEAQVAYDTFVISNTLLKCIFPVVNVYSRGIVLQSQNKEGPLTQVVLLMKVELLHLLLGRVPVSRARVSLRVPLANNPAGLRALVNVTLRHCAAPPFFRLAPLLEIERLCHSQNITRRAEHKRLSTQTREVFMSTSVDVAPKRLDHACTLGVSRLCKS